jgi:hypothetical protein
MLPPATTPPPCASTPQHTGAGAATSGLSASQQQQNRFFSVRLVSLDYYLAPPLPGLDTCFSSLEGSAVDVVPVVRVFGATPAGQRVCLHLHQVRAGCRVVVRAPLSAALSLTAAPQRSAAGVALTRLPQAQGVRV